MSFTTAFRGRTVRLCLSLLTILTAVMFTHAANEITMSYNTVLGGPAQPTVSELGTSDTFSMTIAVDITADIVVELQSSDTAEGVLSKTQYTFFAGTTNTTQSVQVTGKRDNSNTSGDGKFVVTVTKVTTNIAGADSWTYQSMECINKNIVWPTVENIDPLYTPMYGTRNITIVGTFISTQAKITCAGIEAQSTPTTISGSYATATVFTTPSITGLANAAVGYYPIVVTNPDGGFATQNTMYYDDVCSSKDNMVRSKETNQCIPCPDGAICRPVLLVAGSRTVPPTALLSMILAAFLSYFVYTFRH
eukprot:GFYU01015190.1.p1 GENE.GFYU01015190.1~~GFYU01015190.1.p1  ORF type:complete len:306 (+),score=56.78 GFYU01015190.1:85-1002(+)